MVKLTSKGEVFNDDGLDPNIPVVNQHYVSASRQIREMLLNGELYVRHMQGLDELDDEAEAEFDNDEASPFTSNRKRFDDEIIEANVKYSQVSNKLRAKRARKASEEAVKSDESKSEHLEAEVEDTKEE